MTPSENAKAYSVNARPRSEISDTSSTCSDTPETPSSWGVCSFDDIAQALVNQDQIPEDLLAGERKEGEIEAFRDGFKWAMRFLMHYCKQSSSHLTFSLADTF